MPFELLTASLASGLPDATGQDVSEMVMNEKMFRWTIAGFLFPPIEPVLPVAHHPNLYDLCSLPHSGQT